MLFKLNHKWFEVILNSPIHKYMEFLYDYLFLNVIVKCISNDVEIFKYNILLGTYCLIDQIYSSSEVIEDFVFFFNNF